MTPPKVLAVMPVYNARETVRQAVYSALEQTFTDFQLLIINDSSTDDSADVIRAISDPRILYWEQPNQGPGAAMNRALEHAAKQGIPFIARMDADDLSMPDRFERQVVLLEKNPQAAACSANAWYIDARTEETIGTSTVPLSPWLIHWEIRQGLRGLIQPAAMFRTSSLVRVHGYRIEFRQAEDTDLFLRLAGSSPLVNCRDYLVKLRLSFQSLSVGNSQENILHHLFALDCASRRSRSIPEIDYKVFHDTLSTFQKYQLWREETVLKLWRRGMQDHSPFWSLLAVLVDPRRALARLMRGMDSLPYRD